MYVKLRRRLDVIIVWRIMQTHHYVGVVARAGPGLVNALRPPWIRRWVMVMVVGEIIDITDISLNQ